MRIYWALFDQDYLSPDRSYWTWHHNELNVVLLDTFYYAIAHQYHPSRSDRDGTDGAPSEIADVNPDWKCWYQYLDGGRDSQGRPGRFVLLCGFIKRQDFYQTGGSLPTIARLPVIQRICDSASQRPVPPPDDLSVDVAPQELRRASDLNSETLSIANESALHSSVLTDAQLLRPVTPSHLSQFLVPDHVEIATAGCPLPDVKPRPTNSVKLAGVIGSTHRRSPADVGNLDASSLLKKEVFGLLLVNCTGYHSVGRNRILIGGRHNGNGTSEE